MKLLAMAEAEEWLRSKGLPLGRKETELAQPYTAHEIPPDSGRKTALAKSIAQLFEGKDTLIVVREWDIWPSSSNMFLFDAFRRSCGDTRSIQEAPGQLICKDEGGWTESVLALILYFVWEAYVCDARGNAVWISHDEWYRIHESDAANNA